MLLYTSSKLMLRDEEQSDYSFVKQAHANLVSGDLSNGFGW